MGWLFTCDPSFNKARQVSEFRSPGSWSEGTTLLADRVVGNHYWAALQDKSGAKFIFLALMKGGGKNSGWGYKDMTEHCGPYYYDCPLSLLEMTDEPTGESAIAWRKKVREYHAAKKARAKPAAGLVIQYGKFSYRLIESAGPRKGWRVVQLETGDTYRMTAKQLSHAAVVKEAA